jgi:hypothetical protein
MMNSVQSFILNIWKHQPKPVVERHHLMLAGINQRVFLSQWGEPEIKISLDRLKGFYKLNSLFLDNESNEEETYTVWIYKKMDRILFFTKKKLILHFKWTEFKEKWKRPKEGMDYRFIRKPSIFTNMTLSLVA